MKHSVFLILLFSFFPAALVHASSPTITLSQSVASTGSYSSVFSLHSSIFSGRVGTSISDFSASIIPKIDTFAVNLNPVPCVSFFAGSLSSEGLPSRARKLSFTLSSPFHAPLTISSSNTVSTESSAKTGTIAFEFNTDKTDVVLYSARLQGIDEPSWALASKTFHASATEDDALRLSFFSGIKKLIPSNETSWFSAQASLPETDICVSGAEALFHEGLFEGSITGLMNIGRFRKPVGSFRTELNVDRAPFVLSAGYFYSDRQFINLDGNNATVLSRAFFTPLFYAKPQFLANSRISWGAVIYADSSLNPNISEKNIQSLNGGTGIKCDSSAFGFLVQGMVSDDELVSECTIQLKSLIPKKLQASISGNAAFNTKAEATIYAKSEAIKSSLTFNPFNCLNIAAKHTITFKNDSKTIINAGSAELGTNFSTKKSEWEISLEAVSDFNTKPVQFTLSAAIIIQ